MKKVNKICLISTVVCIIVIATTIAYDDAVFFTQLFSDKSSFNNILASDIDDWVLVDSGLCFNKYYNPVTKQFKLCNSIEPLNYFDNSSNSWIPINCSFKYLNSSHPAYSYGYRVYNDQGIYSIYFKQNIQNSYPIVAAYNKSNNPNLHVLRIQPLFVGYLDPSQDNRYEILQDIKSSQGYIDGCIGIYENVFSGTDLQYRYRNGSFKEELILSNITRNVLESNPPSSFGLSNQHSLLVLATKIDYKKLQPCNTSGDLIGNFTIAHGNINFRDIMGRIHFSFPLGYAYEMYNISNECNLRHRMIQYQDDNYILSGLSVKSLYNMTFPVVIDPTVNFQVTASSDDCDENITGYLDTTGINDYSGRYLNIPINSSHRFLNINVPQGSTIHDSTFEVFGTYLGGSFRPLTLRTLRLRISGIDEDNTATFSVSDKPSNRTRTDGHVNYVQGCYGISPIANWKSFNVTTAIQEIIDRVGWSSNNALGVCMDNNGSDSGTYPPYWLSYSYNRDTTKAAKLQIIYTAPPTVNTPVEFSGPDPSNGETDVSLNPTLCINITDNDEDNNNITWYHNATFIDNQTLTIRPVENGSIIECTPTSGFNYECVDEIVCNGEGDYIYIYRKTSWYTDIFNLTNHTVENESINFIRVFFNVSESGGFTLPCTNNEARATIYVNATEYHGTSYSTTSTYTEYNHTWANNPDTSINWTWNDIDTLEAGVSLIGSCKENTKCSQIYIEVNWTGYRWLPFGYNNSVPNGTTICQNNLNFSYYNTNYYWYVYGINETHDNDNTSSVFSFTTEAYEYTLGMYTHIRGDVHILGGRF